MIPHGYEWLGGVGTLPLTLANMLDLVGTIETPGPGNNPVIMGWASEVGIRAEYTADSVPWCGLAMAVAVKRAGYEPPAHPLWALNWRMFGNPGGQPCLGDVLVFVRDGGGHVGLYVAEDRDAYHVLGGNTADKVGIARILKTRLVAVRSPAFKKGRPASSRPYVVASTGKLSTNER